MSIKIKHDGIYVNGTKMPVGFTLRDLGKSLKGVLA